MKVILTQGFSHRFNLLDYFDAGSANYFSAFVILEFYC